ncbi:MAG: hypothetical protein P4L22_01320 [Candidatus Babeliales bacterium]|nr:hypothetical protein [Candidatus Babeliales bacterium]
MKVKNLILIIIFSCSYLYSAECNNIDNIKSQYSTALSHYNNQLYVDAGRIFHNLANQQLYTIIQNHAFYYLAAIYLKLGDLNESYNYAVLALKKGISEAQIIIDSINKILNSKYDEDYQPSERISSDESDFMSDNEDYTKAKTNQATKKNPKSRSKWVTMEEITEKRKTGESKQ